MRFPKEHEITRALADLAKEPNRPMPYDTPADRRRKLIRKYVLGNRRNRVVWGRSRSGRHHEAAQTSSSAEGRQAVFLLPSDPFLILALCVGRHVSRRPWPISGQLLHSSMEREDSTRRWDE
jgi:hypothetical protein